MKFDFKHLAQDFDPRFKIFHELMGNRVSEILLVSSLYDAFILEEDSRLAERIIHEYRGLNLSKPPRLTWVSGMGDALTALERKKFDLVIAMPRLAEKAPTHLGHEIKRRFSNLPIVMLNHNAPPSECELETDRPPGIDRSFIWTGNSDLLLAIVKSVEDRMNAAHDTEAAGVRIILFVEDSPAYMSSLLPILYRVVVSQTQAAIEEGLNEEHRLLTMRARAKILVAENYEDAIAITQKFRPYLLGVISDVRFPLDCVVDREAGVRLLTRIKKDIPDLPLLLTSSEPHNREKADLIPASFIDKNSPTLHAEIKSFFLEKLGFGDFVFRRPGGAEITRVSNVRGLEKALPHIPKESVHYHAQNNDFSRWLFARSETLLASQVRPKTLADFSDDVDLTRHYLIESLKARQRLKRKGVVIDFETSEFDPENDFAKIGKGSLGGKARGLAFINNLINRLPELHKSHNEISIMVPKTLVVTTEGFDTFVETGDLKGLAKGEEPDEDIARKFLQKSLPEDVVDLLRQYLEHIKYPLAVRSSGLLEDAQYRAYAGLYRTYMLPNDHPDLEVRLKELLGAVKLVYASTYYHGPKSFAQRVGQRTEEERMAVIIQQIIGNRHNNHFYPAISGVAQSHNYYPFARMKPEDGCATIALGLGRTVVEGGTSLRFSPLHPEVIPHFSKIEDILKNSQHSFYSVRMGEDRIDLGIDDDSTLLKREISEAIDEPPVKMLCSTYIPEEHRIRDSSMKQGYPVLTFASILKYKQFNLAGIISDLLTLGKEGMGCPVELEFSVNLTPPPGQKPEFAILQIRPMSARAEMLEVDISPEDRAASFCFSTSALGNNLRGDMYDIIYVDPDSFDPNRTMEIADEISRFNAELVSRGKPYLLIGPGRWGSADRWLGIPVTWSDISGVTAVVETASPQLKAEPSQGSHFFHNVTTLGINYLTVRDNGDDHIHWDWLQAQRIHTRTRHVVHVQPEQPFILKVDGRTSIGAILPDNTLEPMED